MNNNPETCLGLLCSVRDQCLLHHLFKAQQTVTPTPPNAIISCIDQALFTDRYDPEKTTPDA